jgi:hypothetical protein
MTMMKKTTRMRMMNGLEDDEEDDEEDEDDETDLGPSRSKPK